MAKNNKRIRHPKKVEKKQKPEEKKHFVLDVHDVSISNKSNIGGNKQK